MRGFLYDKVIISIRDPNSKKADINSENDTIKDVLYLEFYDISSETQDVFKDCISMSDNDAEKIRAFVLKWKDKVNTLF